MAHEHEKSSRDQIITPPSRMGEPGTGDDASALDPYIVAPLGLLGQVIDQLSPTPVLDVTPRARSCPKWALPSY